MSQMVGSFDTSSLGVIHDVQLDYYAKRAAVASGDCTVRILDVTDGRQQQIGHLKGHEGPVTGAPRVGKNLLVLDIDHTIYDPSEFGGSKGSTVRAFGSDQAMVARCRPGLHTFLTEVYKDYDIMATRA
eukprot:s1786_g2.t3